MSCSSWATAFGSSLRSNGPVSSGSMSPRWTFDPGAMRWAKLIGGIVVRPGAFSRSAPLPVPAAREEPQRAPGGARDRRHLEQRPRQRQREVERRRALDLDRDALALEQVLHRA